MEKRCPWCMGLLPPGDGLCPHCGKNPAEYQPLAHQIPPGSVLHGHYVMGRALGSGGFGITYLAWDERLARRVAIKEYYPRTLVRRDAAPSTGVSCYTEREEADYRKGRQSFLKEAQTLSQMGSIPGIVQVYSFFEANNTAYLVMEYLEGETFAQRVQRTGPLTMRALLELLEPVFRALEAVHRAGIIHRDISPDNLMILKDGGQNGAAGGAVKVMDFGCAREIDSAQTMTTMLRHGYAPPEQYTGHNQGPWTDIYALCGVMYYCLSGQAPPESNSRKDGDSLRLLCTPGAGVTAGQEAALLKGLAVKTEERWQSISDLRNALYSEPVSRKTEKQPEAPVTEDSTVTLDNSANNNKSNRGNKDKKTPNPKTFKIGTAVVLILGLLAGLLVYFHPWNLHPWRDNVLMEDWEEVRTIWSYFDYPVFGSEIARKKISSITFLDTTSNAPRSAWDVSQAENQSVLAWAVKYATDDLYNLYIAGNGGVAAPSNSEYLFEGYSNVKQIRFNGAFHTESVTNMSYMFYNCGGLTELDVSDFDTSNVTNMWGMFDRCSNLTALDVSGFDTSNVTNMYVMFAGCGALTALDVSGFDTSNVTNMSGMFLGCSGLTALDVSGFDTSNVTNMNSMFSHCGSLTALDVSGFDISNVTDMSWMFSQCGGLTELDVSGFDTSNVTNMSGMFYGCGGLTALDVSGFDTSNVTSMDKMFSDCGGLTALDISGFDTSNVTDMVRMFSYCGGLTAIYVSERFVWNQTADGADCFVDCTSLVGGNGTAYSSDHVNAEYARIDKPGQPGYFTAKS